MDGARKLKSTADDSINIHVRSLILQLLILIFTLNGAVAQEKKDSTKTSATKKAFLAGLKMVSTNPTDTIVNVESVDNFTQFAGKTIRNIIVERIFEYNYKIFNSWIGYNIGIKKAATARGRHFLTFRYFDGYYVDEPQLQEDQEEPRYNSAYGYLSEFSFYRQNFYKTRYVFGFGRTEDVPYGISLGITGGYVREVYIERPYGAFKIRYTTANKRGSFHHFLFQSGGYFRNDKLEDFVIQGGAAHFTRALNVRHSKFRGLLSAEYTQIINRSVADWLKMSNKYIPGFSADSVIADRRLLLSLQTVLYTPRAILGFRMAPFAQIDMVSIDCSVCDYRQNTYWGLSAGLRTRNENLIFGTIELRATYIPKDEYGESKFVFGFKQNLRVKNTGIFATEPTLIRYNQ